MRVCLLLDGSSAQDSSELFTEMSVSSGSSLCGEQDQDLLLDEEEEIDFYAILNVPKNVGRLQLISCSLLWTSFIPWHSCLSK